jgi:hypothetical protein
MRKVSALTFMCFLILPSLCRAQWVPNPGDGSISLGYQYTRITDHLFSHDLDGYVDPATGYVGGPGGRFYMGDVFGQTLEFSADYGIWRGLAISGSAAYVKSKYTGKSPESPEDDGVYHGSLQDATVELQYMVPWMEFAITSSVGARFPLTNYTNLGHVAVGSHLRQYPLGISVGRSLSPLLPRAFAAGSFTYAFVQNHHEHSLDQRRYEFAAGYIVTKSVSVGGSLQRVTTIDGIDWFEDDLTAVEEFMDHDAAAKAKYVRAGGYISYAVRQGLSVRLSYVGTLSGENSHAGRSFTITPTWNFRAPIIH